ncbi:tRNA wybutosine-synthesizing protein 3 homolog isoform X1 [Haliotis rufescens]|uniref:tRNA wybutosine-synthesizing protein 3 homolog isoform X1 n=1 Tax=Haliotis rufescens TaxID=6454 RepID=UPI001EB08E71|nr:tRNA wybutosine-synthesizing protein 3 homolog isoform X1 [Haliotis rufescens]
MSSESFDKQRESCFDGLDLSRKGSIDVPIVDLVKLINDQSNYFTTSSCSGRILLFEQDAGNRVKKKGCKWLFTSHDFVQPEEVVSSLRALEGDAVFKFEPMVLHVQCRSVADAQSLHACAVASGFRNSGITIGSRGKIITAVRSTHSLEVPLSKDRRLMVSHEYLKFLADCANAKMQENLTRIERFHENFSAMLSKPESEKTKKNRKNRKARPDTVQQSPCNADVEGKNNVVDDDISPSFLFDNT